MHDRQVLLSYTPALFHPLKQGHLELALCWNSLVFWAGILGDCRRRKEDHYRIE